METGEIREELVKLAPASVVSVISLFGVALSDWVCIVTIVYIIIQCICLIYKTYGIYCERKENCDKQ